jgi:hypothetical protein
MNRNDSDKNKQAYYDALVRYEWISKELGGESPAKLAAQLRKVRAAAEAALRQLTNELMSVENIQ